MRDRFFQLALLEERAPQVGMGLGEIRFQLQCLPMVGHGLVKQAVQLQGNAEIGMGLGVLGLQLHGLAVMPHGLIQPAVEHQCMPQMEVGGGKLRLDLQDQPKLLRRLVQQSLAGKCASKVETHCRIGLIDLKHLTVELLGGLQAAALVILSRDGDCI